MVKITDITDEYIERANPRFGRIVVEDGYDRDRHTDEIATATWLWETFGGDIVLLDESEKQGAETPDYLWREQYWERKGLDTSKSNTVDTRVRKAYSQIDERRGGIIIDFSKSKASFEQAKKMVWDSALKRARGSIDIIVCKKSEFAVLKVTKK